jgi:3-isopropylmalate/(R)-2-methylmalate dehydratase small subunit
LKHAGVQAVVAKSFARIYFRNAINLGLPVLQSGEAAEEIQACEDVEIDFAGGKIITARKVYSFPPLPDSVIGILEAGGLIEYTKKRLQGLK